MKTAVRFSLASARIGHAFLAALGLLFGASVARAASTAATANAADDESIVQLEQVDVTSTPIRDARRLLEESRLNETAPFTGTTIYDLAVRVRAWRGASLFVEVGK